MGPIPGCGKLVSARIVSKNFSFDTLFVFTERCISIKKLLTRAAAGLFAQQPPEEVRCSALLFILRICAGRRQKGRAFKYIAGCFMQFE
jgi:hypothetical protein